MEEWDLSRKRRTAGAGEAEEEEAEAAAVPPKRRRDAGWAVLTCQGSWADRSLQHEAASQGRLLSLKTYIAQGCNVNALTIDQVTPLHEACLGGHVSCARALIQAGAMVNAMTIDGVTPLVNACVRGSPACVKLLLESGATLYCAAHTTPLHEAAARGHVDVLETLLEFGANIDVELPHTGTALYAASLHGRDACVRALLRAGAGKNAQFCLRGRQQGVFPHHSAARGIARDARRHNGCARQGARCAGPARPAGRVRRGGRQRRARQRLLHRARPAPGRAAPRVRGRRQRSGRGRQAGGGLRAPCTPRVHAATVAAVARRSPVSHADMQTGDTKEAWSSATAHDILSTPAQNHHQLLAVPLGLYEHLRVFVLAVALKT
ncbi:uncharacterized protein LOC116939327 isoform X2 [Petromyzon marinus]|uniref:Ankyrin repeat and SOCS box protein 18-like isoform X2 n=1 Tax=Petromyzon marinus TaxID=7757 RepID=A0AAJ7WMZ9_PETMA|nr:ankyrin repeat and SOCS box protein 18-like isoform X2 [Petromyzon marinus]